MRIAEFSAQWEGRTIDGVFSLRQLLGSGESSAVFLTTLEGRPAAIKLLYVEPQKVDAQMSQWRAAARLSHPNLIRIHRTGRCEMDGLPLSYIVMEYAEEDLSQVLPHRSLSPAEAKEMLEPTLGALEYLHRQGFVHARLKPANIMAVDDCLKLSSDGVCRAGAKDEIAPGAYDPPERLSGVVSPAGDLWSLGMTLIEVLTGRRPSAGTEIRVPDDLPEPFAALVRHSLARDARERWTVPQISKYLAHPEGTSAASPEPPSRRRYMPPVGVLILLALVVVVVAGVMIRHADTGTAAQPAPAPVTSTTAAPEPPRQPEPEPPKPAKAARAAKTEAPKPKPDTPVQPAQAVSDDSGAPGQPMPEITSQARSTIRGKVRVNVKVDVDPSGAVTDAKIESGNSKYFSELALKSVRQWKFDPVQVNGSQASQRWRVRFDFLRTGTKVQRQRLSP